MSTDRTPRDDAPHGGRSAQRDRSESAAQLEELLVRGGAAVVATDLDGVITHWTAGAERLYGWTAEEAIGQPVLELLVAPSDRPSARAHLRTIRETGSADGEFALLRKEDGVLKAYVHGTVIKDDAGRSVGLLGLSMDVSA